jgi:hypothetical protein
MGCLPHHASRTVPGLRFRVAALLVAGCFLAWPLLRPLQAQDSTIVITDPLTLVAASQGFGFALSGASGSRCFGLLGQNEGRGTWTRATSEALNLYGRSVCRHTGFGVKNLQNGWKVRTVLVSVSCQFSDFGTWKTLGPDQCAFRRPTTPTTGAVSAFFDAEITLLGRGGQDRRATLTWRIEIQGPRGTSPWTAQAPATPVLLSPSRYSRLTSGTENFSWSAPATGATDYRLCLSREANAGACEVETRVAGTSVLIPAVPFRGERVSWFVKACNTVGCTSSADRRLIINALPSAILVSPAAGATTATRKPTFQWQSVPGAQTYEIQAYHPSPLQTFTISSLSSNQTQFTPATDLTLANAVYWAVNACTVAAGCGSPSTMQQSRTFNLPAAVSFATDLAPSFRSPRCVNCHAVVATSFARSASPGLPANHPAVGPTMNTSTTVATSCRSCHTDALLPPGSVNPGWKAPAASMDLRNLTDAQLCLKAQDPGIAGTALNHLTQDRLILWAIGGGSLPAGATMSPVTTAPPQSISTWTTRVQAWITAGMPCN